jgi:hypothetical protein
MIQMQKKRYVCASSVPLFIRSSTPSSLSV